MSDTPMTRADAISHLQGLSWTVDGQMCAGRDESDRLEAETREALRLLGVTDEELDT